MKRLFIAAITAATLATGITAVAGAKPDRLLATPANVCRDIVTVPTTQDLYTSFGECMGRLNKDVAAFRWPSAGPGSSLISIEERCIQLEAGIFVPPLDKVVQVSYPFFFEEPDDWRFPEYWAQNRNQCENTLYAYHAFTGEVQ
jgi:hypothetical protein